jgi:KDO2-lipid IV(A) lauroyltransferase
MTAIADGVAPDPVMTAGIGTRARNGALNVGTSVVSRLPEGPLVAAAEAAGELWYRTAPARATQGRLNLERVCRWLAANDLASPRVHAAANDPRALERLLRSAFRHAARYYLEVARTPGIDLATLERRVIIETPETVAEAIATGRVIFVGLHFGSVEVPAMYIAAHSNLTVTVPMETIGDPGLQAWFERTRGATGVRLVDVRHARSELLSALREGRPVGLVGDRDLTGGGVEIEFFGVPAKLPAGPGLLAVETGAPVYATAVRRTKDGYRGRVDPIEVPQTGSRRERVTGYLQNQARAYERIIATAPDQWWAIFFPIWPDLVVPGKVDEPGAPAAAPPNEAAQ